MEKRGENTSFFFTYLEIYSIIKRVQIKITFIFLTYFQLFDFNEIKIGGYII